MSLLGRRRQVFVRAMGHGGTGTAVAVVDHHSAAAGCRVLPVIMEEEPPATESHQHGSSPPETRAAAERRKAIVARMRELLSRAAAAQAAHSRLRRSTVATARKWKRAVGRIQKRGVLCKGDDGHERVATVLEDDGALLASASSSSSISSNGSFSWDAADDEVTFCSSAATSCPGLAPLLWPALVPSPPPPPPATSTTMLRLSCGSSSWSAEDDDDGDDMRMAHWVTTDSDFVVLEL